MDKNPWKKYRLHDEESLTSCIRREEEKEKNAERRWEIFIAIAPYIAFIGVTISQILGWGLSERKDMDTVMEEMRKRTELVIKKSEMAKKKDHTQITLKKRLA